MYFQILVVTVFLLSSSIYLSLQNRPLVPGQTTPLKQINWGIVDNYTTFDNSKDITFENTFASWKQNDTSEIQSKLDAIIAKGRTPILTLEPWPFDGNGEFLYNKILEGNYDSTIIEICNVIQKKSPNSIYLRFAHEMDLVGTSRYPWTNSDFNTFKLMFRRSVELCRKQAKNVKIVWSPGGRDIGFTNYYPGKEYVDVIGFSVFSFEEYELKTIKKNLSFVDLFDYKYNAVKEFQKPVMIAELGVSGSEEYKKQWISQALERIKSPNYQRFLTFVVYLNAKDETPWDPNLPSIKPPDFRISPDQFPAISKK
jgi:endoglucanase